MKPKVHLMLDSGAFSGWSGAASDKVRLRKYCDFIERYKDIISVYVNLDQIPGKNGKWESSGPSLQASVEASAKKSYENLERMRDRGLKPMPVFHQGENLYWLEKMLKDGERYIGIGLNQNAYVQSQVRWLDEIFTLLTDKQGRPLIRTHGFGATKHVMLTRYPWSTVDSTTWATTPAYGKIIVPHYENGKPDFLKKPHSLSVSGILLKHASNQLRQYDLLGDIHRQWIDSWLTDCGVTVLDVKYNHRARRKVLLRYYMGLERARGEITFDWRKKRVSGQIYGDLPDHGKAGPLTIYFASTPTSGMFQKVLTEEEAWFRLYSFNDLESRSEEFIRQMIIAGLNPPNKIERITRPAWHRMNYRHNRAIALLARIRQQGEEKDSGENDAFV